MFLQEVVSGGDVSGQLSGWVARLRDSYRLPLQKRPRGLVGSSSGLTWKIPEEGGGLSISLLEACPQDQSEGSVGRKGAGLHC